MNPLQQFNFKISLKGENNQYLVIIEDTVTYTLIGSWLLNDVFQFKHFAEQ